MKNPFFTLVGASAAAVISLAAWAEDLRIGGATDRTSIDPHFWNFTVNNEVAMVVFDQLIERDAKGQPTPNLAVSWKSLDDLTWELKLRKGVKWHDGSPFTADDVVFTFKRIRAGVPGSPGGFAGFIAGREVVKIDDHTIRLKSEKPYPLTPRDLMTFVVISKKHGEGATTADYNTGKATIGTGPYKFVEWVRGDRIVLEANPGFWGDKPQWDRIIYKPIKSGPSRVAALLNGDVDMINNVPSQDIARLKKESGIVLHQEASTRVIFLISDANRDVTPFVKDKDGKQIRPNPLRDWRVRKAMSKAIDREAIVARVMQGAARSAGQIVQEGVFGHNPDVKVEPYDPEGAKDLLSQAGYGGGFNLTIQVASDRGANEVDTVEAVAQMLTRIGIKTEVMGVPNNAFIPKAKRGEWSMLLMGWTMDTAEPSGPLRLQLHSYTESLGTWNLMRYSNRRLDDVIEAALVTMDAAKRDKLFQEAAAISMRDVAWIPLYNEVNTWGSRKGVRYEARADNYTLAKKVFKAN